MPSWFPKGDPEDKDLAAATRAGRLLRPRLAHEFFHDGLAALADVPERLHLTPRFVFYSAALLTIDPAPALSVGPEGFLSFSDEARKRLTEVLPPQVAQPVIGRLEIVATTHTRRARRRVAVTTEERQRRLSRALNAASEFRRALDGLAGCGVYSLGEALDAQAARADIDGLSEALDFALRFERGDVHEGRPREDGRRQSAAWVAGNLARSGVRLTTTQNGALWRALFETLRLAGEPVPVDLTPIVRRAIADERNRQEHEGLMMFNFAREHFKEPDAERIRREEWEAERDRAFERLVGKERAEEIRRFAARAASPARSTRRRQAKTTRRRG